MRLISKKIWIISFILLIPYVFIYVICFHRTDKEALMPGGLSNVNSLIEIDSDNKEEGSFNSIYFQIQLFYKIGFLVFQMILIQVIIQLIIT